MDLRQDVVRGMEGIQALGPEIDALVTATAGPVSMYSSSTTAYLEPRPWITPVAVTVRRGGVLEAAAVLGIRPDRWGRQVVKAGVLGEPFALLVADRSWAGRLADAMIAAFDGIHRSWRVHLTDLAADDPTADALMARVSHGRESPMQPTPSVRVDVTTPLSDVLSRNVRSARNKALNRVARAGRVLELEWVTDADRVHADLPVLVELHVARNEQLRGRALLLDPPQRQTFCEVLRRHAAASRVRLLETRIDGEVAAFAACLVSGGRWWVWSNYAHPDWPDFSPGTITNAEVVRAAHADPTIDVIDWGPGVQRYKMSGGAVLLQNREVQLWRHPHWAWASQLRRLGSS